MSINWLGLALHCGSFVLLNTVIAFASTGAGKEWNSAFTISIFIVWALVLAAYVCQQAFSVLTDKASRIFPVELCKSRTMILLYIGTSALTCAHFVTLYYFPLYFQLARGDTAIRSAVRMLPVICSNILSGAIAGAVLPQFKRYAVLYLISGSLILIGTSLMFTVNINTISSKVYGYGFVIGLGTGFTFQTSYSVATKAPPNLKPRTIPFIYVAQIGIISLSLLPWLDVCSRTLGTNMCAMWPSHTI